MMPKINEKPNGVYDQARIDLPTVPMKTSIAVQEIHDTLRNNAVPSNEPVTMMDMCIALARAERRAKAAEDARDMLATRCAEQAHQIAQMATTIMARNAEIDYMAGGSFVEAGGQPLAEAEAGLFLHAIAVMQRQGVR